MLNIIPKNSKLLLAISGGPDSVYLLYQLLKIKKKKNIDLHLAHLNHNIRGKESNNDEIFIKKTAKKLKIPLTCKKLNKKSLNNKISENKMRQLRYKFLEDTRQKEKCDYLLTAHHLDDQIETIIFNFIRGTGPTGLIGMKYKQRKILRPLLNTSKEEILEYLKNNKIKYRIDKTNQDINYSRNFIRHKIVPQFKKLNPNLKENILKLSDIQKLQQNYIDKQTKLALKKITTNFQKCTGLTHQTPRIKTILSLTKFKSLHPAIQLELLKIILKNHVPPPKQLTYKILTEVQNILLYSQGGSQKILFNTLSISKKNDKIYLHLL